MNEWIDVDSMVCFSFFLLLLASSFVVLSLIDSPFVGNIGNNNNTRFGCFTIWRCCCCCWCWLCFLLMFFPCRYLCISLTGFVMNLTKKKNQSSFSSFILSSREVCQSERVWIWSNKQHIHILCIYIWWWRRRKNATATFEVWTSATSFAAYNDRIEFGGFFFRQLNVHDLTWIVAVFFCACEQIKRYRW